MKNSKLRAYYWTIKRSSWIHTLRAHVSRSSLLHLSAEPETAAAPSPYDQVWIEQLHWDQQQEDEFIMSVLFIFFSHMYFTSHHITVIPLIYLQTSIFTTHSLYCINIYWINSFVLTKNLKYDWMEKFCNSEVQLPLRTWYFIIMKLLHTPHLSKKK